MLSACCSVPSSTPHRPWKSCGPKATRERTSPCSSGSLESRSAGWSSNNHRSGCFPALQAQLFLLRFVFLCCRMNHCRLLAEKHGGQPEIMPYKNLLFAAKARIGLADQLLFFL